MHKTSSQIILALVALGIGALPAMAHDGAVKIRRPYVIEKSCDYDNTDCTARMLYAPGQNPGLAGYGSYWFPRAARYVRVWNEDHVNWCYAHYKTYDPHSNTFIGKRYRHYRCNSPYDGI